jgi:dihydropteroate synthase
MRFSGDAVRESEKKTMEMESNVKTIRVGDRILDLSRPAVMAIVNVTPDSFFAGSRTAEAGAVRERVRRAVAEGASIIDVGGYSSRPGAADVPAEEELRRVSLAVEAVRDEYPETLVSVDTFRASVAEGVMARFGPCIVNDISAGELDSGIMEVAARYGVPYIAMHMRGTPADMQGRTAYGDIVGEVAGYLAGRLEAARRAGVRDVVLDLGFGFAKTTAQNYELLGGMREIAALGCPLLAGISRKSMIYKVLDTVPEEALNGTTALHWECLRQGADLLRVHDVAQAVEVVRLFGFYREHGNI